ncbi:HtaA domain-containing protein [Streptomyces sp. NPDC059070]|uniref:HtaA domain-containing protein n=1 Tax=Streptomyces sp. NPDC059070 TaxID=3346713 RepID=UPI0036CF43C5
MSVTPRLRPTARTAAIAVVCAATATTAVGVAPAFAAPAASAAPAKVELKNATLDWGFKESFRRYIGAGGITVGGGARQAAGNGPFTFVDGTGTYDLPVHASASAFKGSVRFTAHGGVLDITLSDLKVSTTAKTGVLTADVTKKDGGKDTTADDVPLADLDLSGVRPSQGAVMVFKDIPASLTKQGAEAFNGNYKEGEKLDPATLTFPLGADPTKPDPTKPDPTKPDPTKPDPTKPKPVDPDKVVKARLSWGVKESWRRYIAGGGRTEVAEGASATTDSFGFPLDKGELRKDTRTVNASFNGKVRFTFAAHGNLDIAFGAVRVEAAGTKGTLLVDVTTPQGVKKDVKFASLDLSKADFTARANVVRLTAIPAAFTADGAAVFARPGEKSQYNAGDAIDPVTLALGLTQDADLGDTAGSSGGSTGGSGASGGTGGTGTSGTSGGTGGATAATVGGGSGTGGSVTGGGTAGGTGELAATGSATPTGPLLGAAAAVAVTGAAAVGLARRRGALGRA